MTDYNVNLVGDNNEHVDDNRHVDGNQDDDDADYHDDNDHDDHHHDDDKGQVGALKSVSFNVSTCLGCPGSPVEGGIKVIFILKIAIVIIFVSHKCCHCHVDLIYEHTVVASSKLYFFFIIFVIFVSHKCSHCHVDLI